MKKVLVVAAHLDDEILGCGGTLLKHISDGDIVDVCMVTSPKKEIWTEEYTKKKKSKA